MITFGPVPSRRLGYSLGINHIPPKHCTYACVYCQVGQTTTMEITRREFYPVAQIVNEVEQAITRAAEFGRTIDFLTLVPDGEPTLDLNLGILIRELKKFLIPVAVITNSSLIDRPDVQDELMLADWVSVKVDTLEENSWRKINRPHHSLSLIAILNGILSFRQKFTGELVTETMLVSGINDNENTIRMLTGFLTELQPFKSYLSIPTRPPVESWVRPPDAETLQLLLEVIERRCTFFDLLFESEGDDFVSTGNLVEDILGITAVHPLRESALRKLVEEVDGDWNLIESLIMTEQLFRLTYRGDHFYTRRSSQRV